MKDGLRNVTIKMTDAQIARAESLARKEGRTRTNYLEQLVASGLSTGCKRRAGDSAVGVKVPAEK